jgi:hypothetical protein
MGRRVQLQLPEVDQNRNKASQEHPIIKAK